MQIDVGYDLIYELPQPMPMLLTLHIHHSRAADIVVPDHLVTIPNVPMTAYHDLFGNWISRIVAPAGQLRLLGHAIVNDAGEPDPVWSNAVQHNVQELPEETLVFLLGSRYCETDHLSEIAWRLFSGSPLGWAACRPSATSSTTTSNSATNTRARPRPLGRHIKSAPECARDFAHLAITFCRCLNIPARYCTGYLGDIGGSAMDAPMDLWLV